MTDVCLHCGTKEGRYDHLCEQCFRERTTPSTLPGVLKMKICSTCNYMVNFGSNQRVVSASGDRTLRVWDLATGTELAPLSTRSSWINAVGFMSSGYRLVTVSSKKRVEVWNMAETATQPGRWI